MLWMELRLQCLYLEPLAQAAAIVRGACFRVFPRGLEDFRVDMSYMCGFFRDFCGAHPQNGCGTPNWPRTTG